MRLGCSFREGCLRDRTLRAMPTPTTMLLMTPMALAAGEESVAASADEHGHELGNVAGDTLARALLPDDVAMVAEMHFDHWLGW